MKASLKRAFLFGVWVALASLSQTHATTLAKIHEPYNPQCFFQITVKTIPKPQNLSLIDSVETASGKQIRIAADHIDSTVTEFIESKAAKQIEYERQAQNNVNDIKAYFISEKNLAQEVHSLTEKLNSRLEQDDIRTSIIIGTYFSALKQNFRLASSSSKAEILKSLEQKFASVIERDKIFQQQGLLYATKIPRPPEKRLLNFWQDIENRRITSITQIETQMDVLARRASEEPGYVHEVDAAFTSMQGIPDRRIAVSENGTIQVAEELPKEKVFAIGSKGSVTFDGALSSRGGERYYAVIYPEGFVNELGVKAEDTRVNISRPEELSHAKNKIFQIKTEKGRAQIHVRPTWRNIMVGKTRMSHVQFFRKNALGVVEFDRQGRILKWKRFVQPN